MKQPKIDYTNIDYAAESVVPEVDFDLKDFIQVKHELLDSHDFHSDLNDAGASHIGAGVFIGDDTIDVSQFEEPKPLEDKPLKKSLFNRLFN